MHEVLGFRPTLARFCRWIARADFRVYAPIPFRSPDTTNTEKVKISRILGLCISREFIMLAANRSSPVTDWPRQLAHLAHQECGGPSVGAIGLCLTGGFALSMAVDPGHSCACPGRAKPPVMTPAVLDISPFDLDRVKARIGAEGLTIRGYRFQGDTLSRAPRFETLRTQLGTAFIGTELPDACGDPAGRWS